MTGIVFRDYQKRDINAMVANRRMINANEPGLGKTLESLEAINRLGHTGTLVVCPKLARGVWETEAQRWYGWNSLIMAGTPKQREEIRREFITSDTPIMITNFALLEEVVREMPQWNNIIIDEAHLGGLLNRKSKTFGLVKSLESVNLFLLTGTPVRKGPQDLWGMLHLIDRKRFSSYWAFVNKWCFVVDNGFGKDILGRPKDPKKFNRMLYQHMVRNLKSKVLKDLPEKIRSPYPLTMEGRQLAAYNELLEEMMLETDADLLLTPNRMTQDLRLRQLLVTPRLLGIDEDGIALQTLTEYLIPEQFEAKRAVAVATPFRQAVPYIRAAIERAIPDVHIEEIHGGIKEEANTVARRFQDIKGHRKVLIYTIKSGASWTAHTASTGFMLGYEWDANDNIQAEDRLHRIGQKEHVEWKYLLHKGTVDEQVMDILNEKRDAQLWSMHATDMYERLEAIKAKHIKNNFKKYVD